MSQVQPSGFVCQARTVNGAATQTCGVPHTSAIRCTLHGIFKNGGEDEQDRQDEENRTYAKKPGFYVYAETLVISS
ncbi:hypothetical protein [Microseira wollei]|uniref:Uncharacterized protein n=1 Tax=Microseira wollei NIES-4236 TaxID=2530354 RepID=A0AAV3XBX8_9CYAN|nr:hypothetical protein [Microseira wollei]GET40397.1 hypothetical protein MiSe_52060 [Microseira wollei NIES-4236]